MTIDLSSAMAALTSIGVAPVIVLAAVISVSAILYRRFRH